MSAGDAGIKGAVVGRLPGPRSRPGRSGGVANPHRVRPPGTHHVRQDAQVYAVTARVYRSMASTETTGADDRERTDTESAASANAAAVAALGKGVIHVGGRPATDRLLELGRFEDAGHVLDAGCGVGTTATEIAERYGCRVTGVDIEPSLVERARANVEAAGLGERVSVERGDVLDLGYPDGTFDRVISEAVTMFLDRDRAARELVRVCAPGGLVVDHEACWGRPPTAEARESLDALFPGLDIEEGPEEWVARYRDAGLADVECESGPASFAGPRALLRDEGLRGALGMLAGLVRNPAARRELREAMPHQNRAEPYVDYLVVAGRKPE